MNKYHNKRVDFDGYHFDSIRERERYKELVLLQKAGEIKTLVIHPIYVVQKPFIYNGERIRAITYEADFCYVEGTKMIFEDVKGGTATQTQAFKIKLKLFKKLLAGLEDSQNVEIRIVT